MSAVQIFEYDGLVEAGSVSSVTGIPKRVFTWLEEQCLNPDVKAATWLKLTSRRGQRSIQVSSYVGVLRAPCGFQIEILPKIGRNTSAPQARKKLIEMLKCLRGFRHIKTLSADLQADQMPLLEVFLQQFLETVGHVVKKGLRSDYTARQANMSSLRGRLMMARHLSENLVRRDRFFTEYDEFSPDRAENRLIHTALCKALSMCGTPSSHRLARELCFVFADVPLSIDVAQDFKRVRLDRGMAYYEPALDWARLILEGNSPMPGTGKHHAASLLFPMEALFEAYVAKHLAAHLEDGYDLKAQVSKEHLVSHKGQDWFRLKPDLLIQQGTQSRMVLDTKWKLLDSAKGNRTEKYQLSQTDFYQLHAYVHMYLKDAGHAVLIYPWTSSFCTPLPVFDFKSSVGLKLWVLPFCLECNKLLLPEASALDSFISIRCTQSDCYAQDGAAISRAC
ncbi:2-keto-D-gluconate dehydrogenase [Pseudomonas sp. MAFF 730085]|uniref:2-keto-D-gluconate dehydrogenase n=1 Tax=Pseudomonas kitaguniensis TaxID=2607908 RepID=A0A5N7JWT7_9PSED|nr:McrC family protein [Pseudomonas kitaguniensis]MPQ85848.1 2-keto-D-gluconate dehydrogenase [Pseudomonas kitaguniensis]